MGIVVYNEWQKEGSPLGSSSAVADAGLYRRLRRRCTSHVEDGKMKAFSGSYAQFAHPHCGAEECSWGEGREKTFLTAFNSDNKVFGSPSGCPQEAEVPKAANTRKNRENVNEQLFVATERNAKLRYECEGTASGRSDSEAENRKETLGDVIAKH